jgi:hypothetical protein
MKRKLHKFTKEQAEFIQQHSRGRGNQELTDMFNQHFGLNLRKKQDYELCLLTVRVARQVHRRSFRAVAYA